MSYSCFWHSQFQTSWSRILKNFQLLGAFVTNKILHDVKIHNTSHLYDCFKLMPPPTINRSLKPKRKLSDSLSVTSSTEPSSPRPAPSVDRTRKPHIMCQGSSVSVQKPFDSEFDNGRKQRTAHSPTSLDAIRVPDNIYDNHQVCFYQTYNFTVLT